MPLKMQDGLVYIQPDVGVTVAVANAQFQFISDMAPYLNQAAGLDQKEDFLHELYRIFFDRWPNVEKPGEDLAVTENRKALTRKRIRTDMLWRRFSNAVADGPWRRRLFEEEQKTFAIQLEELLEGDGPIVKPPQVKRTRDEYTPPRYDRRLLPRPKKRSRIIGFIDLTNDSDDDLLPAAVGASGSASGNSDLAAIDLSTDADDGHGVLAPGDGGAIEGSTFGDVFTQIESTQVAVVEG
ncbi:hypothetical protein BJ912DRAFT_1058208 [Pholiota molesta]|nr:hypothetical protein BJ912DRAFT_1058208 [Pholiota molesta]